MGQSFADYTIASFATIPSETLLFYLVAVLFLGGAPALISVLYLSISGVLDFKIVVLVSVATTIVWDAIWYSMGRFFPVAKITKLKMMRRNQKLFEKINQRFLHWQYPALFLSRFIYGTNSFFSFAKLIVIPFSLHSFYCHTHINFHYFYNTLFSKNNI